LKLLLDTNALLWWLEDNPRLGEARTRVQTNPSDVLVSVVSLWECVIKAKTGKLQVVIERLENELVGQGFERLSIRPEHLARLQALVPQHRDPFDLLIIAQAQVEGCAIVTSDAHFSAYDVPLIRCG
jgi:PIN domain nuclease of toxin-antitoxin system